MTKTPPLSPGADPLANQWKTLDKDLSRIGRLEQATIHVARPLVAPAFALAAIVLATVMAVLVTGANSSALLIGPAAAIGAYMALNIGANDVANNMGPAVGARVLSMGAALAIAAVCEVAGALIAGGDVVGTIADGIVSPRDIGDPRQFIWLMMAALVGAAVWVNLATLMGAPVSTTHSVVGGVVGAGMVAAGADAVDWGRIGSITASWIISPLLGGAIAALFLAFIKARIVYVEDKIAAARVWVPVLTGIMAGSFATYLAIKGLGQLAHVGPLSATSIGLVAGVVAWMAARPLVRRQSDGLENRRRSLRGLFGLPLVIAAGLLSFAHGANDVANAVGPLAAIVHTVAWGDLPGTVAVPLWVMLIGALGISIGLLLFGPRLITLVGSEITKLNPMRAYCVAISAAITVIVASWLGLPVSSTHIAVGGVFGVGFFREWHGARMARLAGLSAGKAVPPEERRRRKLVRRSHFISVIAAWIVTVPASAALAAAIFALLHGIAG